MNLKYFYSSLILLFILFILVCGCKKYYNNEYFKNTKNKINSNNIIKSKNKIKSKNLIKSLGIDYFNSTRLKAVNEYFDDDIDDE